MMNGDMIYWMAKDYQDERLAEAERSRRARQLAGRSRPSMIAALVKLGSAFLALLV